jgi:DNA processing protein
MSGWRLAPADRGYPAQLADLGELDGPMLHGVGRRERVEGLAAEGTVTIVGSRRASSHGLQLAERLAADLATAGVTVVSGMAIGIDAAAHRGALSVGGATVAVLAGGPDVVYPTRHRSLHSRIVAEGAVVSDQEPRTVPRKHGFPARNRIMAALAKVVVVVEAAERSGSLITADLAQELGRELGAVPGRVGARCAAGTNQRIKEGAELIRDAQDVLDLLAGVGARSVDRRGPAIEPDAACVLGCLNDEISTVDEVAVATRLDGRRAALLLAGLELCGYVVRDQLGAYAPTGLEPPG